MGPAVGPRVDSEIRIGTNGTTGNPSSNVSNDSESDKEEPLGNEVNVDSLVRSSSLNKDPIEHSVAHQNTELTSSPIKRFDNELGSDPQKVYGVEFSNGNIEGEEGQQKLKRSRSEDDVQEKDEAPLKKLKLSGTTNSTELTRGFSISTSLSKTSTSVAEPPTPVNILYRTRFVEEGKPDRLYFNDVPFQGLDEETADDRKLSILDHLTDVYGKAVDEKVMPESQTKQKWFDGLRSKSPKTVVDYSKHAKVTKKALPLVQIFDESLQEIIRLVVQYYPAQSLSGTIAIHDPFSVLIHHYRSLCSEYDARCISNETANQANPEPDFDHALLDIPKDHPYAKIQYESTPTMSCNSRPRQKALRVLLEFSKTRYEDAARSEEVNYLKHQATWKMLWLLLRPGIDVYTTVHGQLEAFVVEKVTKHSTTKDGEKKMKWLVSVWNLAHTGRQIARHSQSFTIDEYEGERAITTLEVIPCSYLDETDGGKLRALLIERGKKYYEVIRGLPIHVNYAGYTLEKTAIEYKGEAVIDPGGYLDFASKASFRDFFSFFSTSAASEWNSLSKKNSKNDKDNAYSGYSPPGDTGGGERWKTYNDLDLSKNDHDDHIYLLFPRPIPGFALKDKTWKIFDIDHITFIDWSKTSDKIFDHIVLPPKHEGILTSLASKKRLPKQNQWLSNRKSEGNLNTKYEVMQDDDIGHWQADWVEGKGRGQIFLLHGPPGTGKTYSVECVAQYTCRPLLTLTPADIGTGHESLERDLSRWFSLATNWGAVMLIDEADVYMEKRTGGRDKIHQNSLCSVFLRTMEYYTGMLFLTTNRVGQFDEAFLSRIEVALYYPNLSREGQLQVWKGLWEKIEAEAADKYVITKEAKDAIRDGTLFSGNYGNWNGREIRNALQSSLKLAKSYADADDAGQKGPTRIKVELRHLETVAALRSEFDEHIRMANGGATSTVRAQRENIRWSPEKTK